MLMCGMRFLGPLGLLFPLLFVPSPSDAAGQATPPPSSKQEEEAERGSPPEVMIDFLGRRQTCSKIEESHSDRPEALAAHPTWAWLKCSRIPAEERSYRSRFADDPAALAWLDESPAEFRLNVGVAFITMGYLRSWVRRLHQSGASTDGQSPYRLTIDTRAERGRTTLITAAYRNSPPRTVALSNAKFPRLDLNSLQLLFAPEPQAHMMVKLRFGYPRGYCGWEDDDDRPSVELYFSETAATASYLDMTNCRAVDVEIPADELLRR